MTRHNTRPAPCTSRLFGRRVVENMVWAGKHGRLWVVKGPCILHRFRAGQEQTAPAADWVDGGYACRHGWIFCSRASSAESVGHVSWSICWLVDIWYMSFDSAFRIDARPHTACIGCSGSLLTVHLLSTADFRLLTLTLLLIFNIYIYISFFYFIIVFQGIFFSYMEGRRSTEVLSSAVNAAIIFGGGLARAVGSAILTMLPKSKEAWMPLIATGRATHADAGLRIQHNACSIHPTKPLSFTQPPPYIC